MLVKINSNIYVLASDVISIKKIREQVLTIMGDGLHTLSRNKTLLVMKFLKMK